MDTRKNYRVNSNASVNLTDKAYLQQQSRNQQINYKDERLPPFEKSKMEQYLGMEYPESSNQHDGSVMKDDSLANLINQLDLSDESSVQQQKNTLVHQQCAKEAVTEQQCPRVEFTVSSDYNLSDQYLREEFPVSSGHQHKNISSNLTDQQYLREEFPVSSGRQHKYKDNRLPAYHESKIDNYMGMEYPESSGQMRSWSNLWGEPPSLSGRFTGSTGVQILSKKELSSGYQAWTKKDQLKKGTPVNEGMGMQLLQKMGWKPGEGLGKNKEGNKEPILLDVKVDKKGLTDTEEAKLFTRQTNKKPLCEKHPVTALIEYCTKMKWRPPMFYVVIDKGTPQTKQFLMAVVVNDIHYFPDNIVTNKKDAKLQAAKLALENLGILPKPES